MMLRIYLHQKGEKPDEVQKVRWTDGITVLLRSFFKF